MRNNPPLRALRCILILPALILAFSLQPKARAAIPVPDGKHHTFALRDSKFLIDDQPVRIIAGEMHPGRIPYQFWDANIKKARAMGLNTISVYFFWNQIEPAEGKFDWEAQNDMKKFVELCRDNGMWVALRPGPYVCAEIEFGGFPAWLLKHKDMKIRNNDPQFLAYCKTYVEKLHEQLGDLQITHGGPILMVQFENELSGINPYLRALHDIFVNAGWDTQLFTCDHSGNVWSTINGIPGVLRAYNGMASGGDSRIVQATAVNKPMGFPIYSPEVYTAWFSKWGEPLAKKSIAAQLKDTQWLLDHKDISFCYYVVDGGTNFGFSAGSNSRDPVQTSYDYDAPIDELGRVTPKLLALRAAILKSTSESAPQPPANPKVIDIPAFSLALDSALLDRLPAPSLTNSNAVSMEDLDQNYGFVLYRKKFPAGIKGTLDLTRALDYSWVMINGKVVGENFVKFGKAATAQSSAVPPPPIVLNHSGPCTVDILVHNLGRTSSPFNQALSRKGMQANPTLDGAPISGWDIYSLPMDDPKSMLASGAATKAAPTGPALYRGAFNLSETGETYLDLRNWHFGVVYVNGHNLGRYWEVGGARSLYLPSCWQKTGSNEIVILELGKPPANPQITGGTAMIEEAPRPIEPLWK